jgi:hypothetical protein
MSGTIREIVDDAMLIVGEIAGPGTQAFSEDRMMVDAIRAFDTMFKKYYWPQFMLWHTVALNGTTGKITTDAFPSVKDFEDFICICRANENTPLPLMPTKLNPNTLSSGSRVLYWTSLHASDALYDNRKLQFYPITATGNMNILARTYPINPVTTDWDWDDVMYLDRHMLAAGTA